MNHIDSCFFINLESRPDRLEKITLELERFGLKSKRFNAIKTRNGAIGCGKSHVSCLKQSNGTTLILEDDIKWTMTRQRVDSIIESFISKMKWDVLILSGVVNCSVPVMDGISKAIDVQTTTAYIVNKHYVQTLIDNFQQAVENMESGKPNNENAIDIYWKKLQKTDNWYVMTPSACVQSEGYSDIEKKVVNYTNYFEKPFTVRLMGGLGNRLFQLAFGMSLARKTGCSFNLCNKMPNEHSNLSYSWFERGIPSLKVQPTHLFNEPGEMAFTFLGFPQLSPFGVAEFVGYYQNEKYFSEFKQEIYQQFTPQYNKVLEEKYPLLNHSYFIHVRRGDYVGNTTHEVDLTRYYEKCIDKNEHYYVFSDDLNWCRNFMNNTMFTLVDENEIDCLYLMSRCWKGGICANSSYSWWGSYLNPNPSKKVYFPSKWINKDWNIDVYPSYSTIVSI